MNREAVLACRQSTLGCHLVARCSLVHLVRLSGRVWTLIGGAHCCNGLLQALGALKQEVAALLERQGTTGFFAEQPNHV